MKTGGLKLLEPSWTLQASTGVALPFDLHLKPNWIKVPLSNLKQSICLALKVLQICNADTKT